MLIRIGFLSNQIGSDSCRCRLSECWCNIAAAFAANFLVPLVVELGGNCREP